MQPILITDILSDPELGAVLFTVTRQTCTRSHCQPTVTSQTTHSAVGCIHPAQPDELEQLPEEYRHADVIVIYSTFAFSVGENFGSRYTLADQLDCHSGRYRVFRVKNWLHLGYMQAWAVRISPQEDV